MSTSEPSAAHSYHGLSWVEAELPLRSEHWPPAGDRFFVGPAESDFEMSRDEAKDYVASKAWIWPSQIHYFFSDVHADADAFANCLVASGGVEKTGPRATDFELTVEGRSAVFVIGGDCFDKGPRNLPLLRALRHLIDKGADVKLLAGNHDLRTVLGIAYTGNKRPELAHLFVRMGQKSMTLFKEICEEYGVEGSKGTDDRMKEHLFPPASWYEEFPKVAGGLIPPKKLKKELVRIREKESELSRRCQKIGLTLSQVYAAVEKAKELFLDPEGEFSWFFDRMDLAYRAGSFLFVHAGVDDTTARMLRNEGVEKLNAAYRDLYEKDLFTLYHGPIGNSFRTKYRDIDFPLTAEGVRDVHASGIYAIIHGHRNLLRGQRLMFRRGLMNFECDSSVDRNTRELEGLRGAGGAATVLHPDCDLRAVSTDYPAIKIFDPSYLDDSTTIIRAVGPKRRRPLRTSCNKRRKTMAEATSENETAPASAKNGDTSKVKFKFHGVMQREEAINYFGAILEGLKQGTLHFKQGDRSLVVNPSERMDVEVKASRKGRDENVSFELSWRQGESELEISPGD